MASSSVLINAEARMALPAVSQVPITGGPQVPMSQEGVAASFFMHQAEMATWGSFQGWFLFLQENSKNEFVLGRTLLEFIKAFC